MTETVNCKIAKNGVKTQFAIFLKPETSYHKFAPMLCKHVDIVNTEII